MPENPEKDELDGDMEIEDETAEKVTGGLKKSENLRYRGHSKES